MFYIGFVAELFIDLAAGALVALFMAGRSMIIILGMKLEVIGNIFDNADLLEGGGEE